MATKTMIYIVRHGETDWNIEQKMQGHTDIPLNTKGKQQAREIATHLKDIDFDIKLNINKKESVFLKNIGSVTTYNVSQNL